MRALIQRVSFGKVTVDNQVIARIGQGLVVLLGIGRGDGEEQAAYLAEKIANLRIFEDEEGKTNLSIQDVRGEAIVVSQFTLYADTQKGRRPSFVHAAGPEIAGPLVGVLLRQGVSLQGFLFGLIPSYLVFQMAEMVFLHRAASAAGSS